MIRRLLACVVLALILAACGGADMSGPLPSRVKAWARGSQLSSTTVTLRSDLASIKKARSTGNVALDKTACAVLAVDVQTAHGSLPTPDKTLTGQLNSAYQTWARAAQSCYQAAGAGNRRGVESAATVEAHGTRQFNSALATLAHFGFRPDPSAPPMTTGSSGFG